MDTIFFTLQDFMTYTKGINYLLMGLSLLVILAYSMFLLDRDDD
ncbi:hmc operon protein 4 [bacterium]|nr:hmc operon protein 4 [bacterium]